MTLRFFVYLMVVVLLSSSCTSGRKQLQNPAANSTIDSISWIETDTASIVSEAQKFLKQAPEPITSFRSARSAGSIHDFHSEGDYWWPDPNNPDGPYIQLDGQSNPDIFNGHRLAMRNLNKWVSTLTAAYLLTNDERYAKHAILHLRSFFLNSETLMNPNLLFAQAIKGKVTGRGIGIIDTIHLIEITKAIQKLKSAGIMKDDDYFGLKKWFNDYATWMHTHPYGLDEKVHGNNHSTWWAAQMAAFADLADRDDLKKVAISQFKVLISAQMDKDGSFPDEIKRTKGYSYTLFNLEGYTILCHILSSKNENLWEYQGVHGSLRKAWEFMMPYIENKNNWPKGPDIAHFDELPIKSVGIEMAACAYKNQDYMDICRKLSSLKKSEEVERTFPLWQAILWF
ncbi:MAG: alginate lyase family protein [Saprospiraceae bacterium]